MRGEATATSDLDIVAALENFYQRGEKEDLISFTNQALDLVGGRLFEGYSSRKGDG